MYKEYVKRMLKGYYGTYIYFFSFHRGRMTYLSVVSGLTTGVSVLWFLKGYLHTIGPLYTVAHVYNTPVLKGVTSYPQKTHRKIKKPTLFSP